MDTEKILADLKKIQTSKWTRDGDVGEYLPAERPAKLPCIVSLNLPSGWDLEQGNSNKRCEPDVLLSITCPLEGTYYLENYHYIVARHKQTNLFKKYGCELPQEINMDELKEPVQLNRLMSEVDYKKAIANIDTQF